MPLLQTFNESIAAIIQRRGLRPFTIGHLVTGLVQSKQVARLLSRLDPEWREAWIHEVLYPRTRYKVRTITYALFTKQGDTPVRLDLRMYPSYRRKGKQAIFQHKDSINQFAARYIADGL